eukprot:scaffold3181_cov167-Amphora_coffeaeformis.AAC.12
MYTQYPIERVQPSSGFFAPSSAKFRVLCPEFSQVPGSLPRVQPSSGFFRDGVLSHTRKRTKWLLALSLYNPLTEKENAAL